MIFTIMRAEMFIDSDLRSDNLLTNKVKWSFKWVVEMKEV